MMNPVRLRALDTVKCIVLERLAGHPARVYLFGSCARGDGGHWSDIDVAIDPVEPLPQSLLAKIDDELEENTVPNFVDVIDLSAAGRSYRGGGGARRHQVGSLTGSRCYHPHTELWISAAQGAITRP